MILIADSGSTKTEWCLADQGTLVIQKENQKSYRSCKTKVMSSKKVGQNFQEKFCPPPLRENLCVRENYQ